jgi:RNA polymerase sigma-70 factor (ECF subfamily)
MVQECLLAVHAARHTYAPERAFRPWMFTVVRHRAIDLLRRQEIPSGSAPEAAVAEPGGGGDELAARLDGEKLLAGLKPEQREAVVLTQYVGLTAAEAASWLEISESSLKARLRRGLKTARKLATDES